MWKLSTLEKKSCTQIEYFKKGDLVAQREIGWRWCWANYEEKPDLSNYDPDKDQIELYSVGDVVDMVQDDGCWEEWEYPESWDAAKITEFEDLWSEEWTEAPATWDFEECGIETWIKGPIEVEETEDIQDDE